VTALEVIRRGMRATPELRRGAGVTILLALLGGAGRVAIPILVQQVLDTAVLDGPVDLSRVYALCAIAAVVVLGTAVTSFLTQRRLALAAESSLFSLRDQAFTHIHRLSIGHQSAERRGALTARVTSDVETLSRFYQWGAIAWIVNGTMMLAALVAMAIYDWRLTLVVIGLAVPLVPVMRIVQGHLIRAYDAIRDRVSELLTVLSEVLQGAALVRGYGQEERATERVVDAIEAHRRATIRGGLIGAFVFPINELFAGFTVAAVVAAGVAIGPGGGLSAGELIAFLFLVQLFLQPVGEFTEVLDQTQTAVAGWRKVLDVLDLPLDVVPPAPGSGVVLPERVAPTVTFAGVSYAYPDDDDGRLVLRDVSFTVPSGASVAMVGATGSGKTTVAKLLTRLADPVAGRILVDGVDLRDVDPESLRRRLVMVPQDGFLFSTTVGENVRFGAPEVSDAAVVAAFDDLGLGPWLASLPFGLDTPVGQRGEHLSVGERQLVALVRAAVASPTCLVLDEATSAVDPLTETRLSRALARLSEGRTSLTIAHRLSTAARADAVLVMDGGLLVESGTHESLLQAGGVYAGLYDSWLRVTAPT